MVRLMVFINSTVPSPSSSYRYSRLPMPTPCSPVPTRYENSDGTLLRGILTGTVKLDRPLYHAVHKFSCDRELFVGLEEEESVEVA